MGSIEAKDFRAVNVSPTLKDVINILKEIYKPDLKKLIENDNLAWEIQQKHIDSKCKLNFLSPLLKILSGSKGYIQAKSYGFEITQPNNHVRSYQRKVSYSKMLQPKPKT